MQTLRMKKSTPGVNIIIIVFSMFFMIDALVSVLPVLFTIMNAFKSGDEYFESVLALPKVWRFENFGRVFSEFVIAGTYYYEDLLINSLWMLAVKVFVNVTSSLILAYGVAKFTFPGKNFLYSLIIFANTIPIIGSGPAGYKLISGLGMIDNPFTIWVAWAGGFDFAFIVFYGAFKGVGNEFSEAAKIDGAGNIRVMLTIILPQVFPSIIAIAITQAQGVWNDYSTSMVYMRKYPTLAYGLYLFVKDSTYITDSKPIYFAAALMSSLPVVILYASNQRFILKNMTAGGLKG